MNLKTRVTTVVIASFVALSVAGGALAQDTVTQEITAGAAGTLTASIGAATLGSVVFSNTAQVSTGTLNLDVVDARGTDSGWNVSVIATAFLGPAPSIGAAGFVYVPGSHGAIVAHAGVLTGVSNAGATGSLVGAHVPLNAQIGSGTGSYTAPLAVSLDIPAQQPIGTYVSTLTVTIATGPA